MAIAVDHWQLLRASVRAFAGVYPVTLPSVANVIFRARAVQGHPAPNALQFDCAIVAMKHSAIRAEVFTYARAARNSSVMPVQCFFVKTAKILSAFSVLVGRLVATVAKYCVSVILAERLAIASAAIKDFVSYA